MMGVLRFLARDMQITLDANQPIMFSCNRCNREKARAGKRCGKAYIDFGEKWASYLSEVEVIAICAHELAHYKKKHQFIIGCAGTFVLIVLSIAVFYLILPPLMPKILIPPLNFSHYILVSMVYLIAALILFFIMLFVLIPFKRYYEFTADRIATEHLQDKSLGAALRTTKELEDNGQLKRDFFSFFSHPSLENRINKIDALNI